MAEFTHIRDEIVINGDLRALVASKNLPPGSKIRLVGRQIQHDFGFEWDLVGQNVVIVAGLYDNNAGRINVSGANGAAGPPGGPGAQGRATGDANRRPGGTGGAGGGGAAGTAATSMLILSEFVRAGELRLFANGGAGGMGGEGGPGGKGGNGRRILGPEPDIIEGTSGGNGGSGGSGGRGGGGGQVSVVQINKFVFANQLQASGGPGGAGGPGGRPGAKGALSEEDNGRTGPVGATGPQGIAGQVTNIRVSADEYWARVRAELGPVALEWAAYRLAVGEYNYRRYNPLVPARSGLLILAMREFESVLRLDPANARAAQLRKQILLNQNALGLPNDHDLIPDFVQYIKAFTDFGGFVFGVANLGLGNLIETKNLEGFRELLTVQQGTIAGTVDDTRDELVRARGAEEDTEVEVKEAEGRVAEVNSQIQAAQEEMNNQSISIGDIVGIVGEIGGAVASIIAIVPTGGASLAALVPDVIALTQSLGENAGPIIKAVFSAEAPDLDNLNAAYKQVNRDATEVIKDAKEVISFVNTVRKLTAGTTPDNSKVMALVRRGTELVHAQLLAKHRKDQATQFVTAVNAKLARAEALLVKTRELLGTLRDDTLLLRAAGLSAIRSAQMHIDSVLGFAFLAQRSAEIYTLKTEVQNLFLDAGYVHPDVDRDFAEGRLGTAALIDAYTRSWATLLQPTEMQKDYLTFFSGNDRLDNDSRRLSFTDPELLQRFRDTHDLEFTLELSDLPAEHFDAKVQGVFVSFVGATSPSGVISCEVRHGHRYEQKRPDGTVAVQLLKPHADTQQGRTERLALGGVDFGADPPLTAPQSLAFWGRGAAGLWGVSIPQSEFDLDPPDLSGLTEIQVWVGYQFIR